ncbi:hypothetical protein ABIC28_004161 [Rhodococcus sp. PvR044]|jgi:hypothetical protein|nr:hypothetical protein [Rhodococcus sp. PvR099]PTR45608.1 uncharacterized protein DUF1876 [Rhodococcus sp. OK611]SNX89158.1 protein of unknown function [Rhodococcus sp. OK270]
MMDVKQWSVGVVIDEHDGRTRAKARLSAGEKPEMVGVGLARLNPEDADVPAIGDELATARALADLSHQLIEATAADIEEVTKQPSNLYS